MTKFTQSKPCYCESTYENPPERYMFVTCNKKIRQFAENLYIFGLNTFWIGLLFYLFILKIQIKLMKVP